MTKVAIILYLIMLLAVQGFAAETVENVSRSAYPSEEAFVALNQAGEICVVWAEKFSAGHHKIYYSIKKRGAWSSPAPISPYLSSMNSLPHVGGGPGNNGFCSIWHDESVDQMKVSIYNGSSWSTPMTVSDTGGYHFRFPKIVAGTNKIVTAWEKGNPISPDIFTRTMQSTWGRVSNASNTTYTSKECDMYMGPSNRAYVVWREKQPVGNSARYDIIMAYDSNSGNWSANYYVTDGSFAPYKPIIAVHPNNNILVGYYHGGAGAYFAVLQVKNSWQSPYQVGPRGNHQDHDYYYADACATSAGFLYVFRDIGMNIRYAYWNGESWADSVFLTNTGNTFHPSVAYSSKAGAYAVWTDRQQNNVLISTITIQSGDDDDEEPPPNQLPEARFTYQPTEGLYPLPVFFDASGSIDPDGKIISYQWTMGDGTSETGRTPVHIYGKKGTYTIVLTVMDDTGATATASGRVNVFGLEPPQNIAYQKFENKNLFTTEYIYKVTWEYNPRNIALGANIINYKIFRRISGQTYSLLKTVSAVNYNEYYDRSLGSDNINYHYTIVAVDDHGRESELLN